MRVVYIALGANVAGLWGTPCQTLERAIAELDRLGVRPRRISLFYNTKPVGRKSQPGYVNAVMCATTTLSARALLGKVKGLENAAGRRRGPINGPRPLDLDIIDYNGRTSGWPVRRRDRTRLVLPHPQAHRRAFVLRPLLDIAPHWVHPVLKVPGRTLLKRSRDRGEVVELRPTPVPATHWAGPRRSNAHTGDERRRHQCSGSEGDARDCGAIVQ